MITFMEDRATIKGFADARNGKEKSENPYINAFQCESVAWDHGFECWNKRILPWAVEKIFHEKSQYDKVRKIKEHFEQTAELPSEVLKILRG